VTFVIGAIPTAVLSFGEHTIGPAQATWMIAIAACVLLGTVASWIVIAGNPARIDAKPAFKKKVRIALALGVLGGCGFLIALAGYATGAVPGAAGRAAVIGSWVVFCAPSIALMAYQFVTLTRG